MRVISQINFMRAIDCKYNCVEADHPGRHCIPDICGARDSLKAWSFRNARRETAFVIDMLYRRIVRQMELDHTRWTPFEFDFSFTGVPIRAHHADIPDDVPNC